MHCYMVILISVIATAKAYSTLEELEAILECDDEFETMMKLEKGCQREYSVAQLAVDRKSLDVISGQLLATMLGRYCESVEEVDTCVKVDLAFSSCPAAASETYESATRKTNWACRPEVLELLRTKLAKYRMVSLRPDSRCYQESVKRTKMCLRRFMSHRPDNLAAVLSRAALSVPCTYRNLKKVCSADEALVLTLVNYDWLILPPVLGVNVTKTLLSLLP